MTRYAGRVNAPEFPDGVEWLNTDHPVKLRDLRGKVVLLDFWTFCCINCMHVIPDLKKLEKKYPDELAVIGVHSAKFTTERETDNIRQAILRYEIEHPVINDRDMAIWQEYAVHAWPTLYLIDPAGRIVGYSSGEGVYQTFDDLIGRVIAEFDAQGKIDRRPLRFRLERSRAPQSVLAFPGKVLADEASGQLFIADSNHNRIVVAGLADREVKEVIGSGEAGMSDGPFDRASFNHPQGMAFDGRRLYVADTENHAIRKVDFEARTVTTIAGTGEQARQFNVAGPGPKTALNSPWDLVLAGGFLYIAMAGPHQIWVMDPAGGEVRPFAGTGREARLDGPLDQAALAQPSGITTDGSRLYFADSEVSSIRQAGLGAGARVETIAGGDLFEFGDRDGRGLAARLQHPLGVAWHDGAVYVADTYNNKIRKVNPGDSRVETFLGTGEAGYRDGDHPLFDEPGGLSVAGGKLYIADTNNNSIRVADLRTRRVETLRLERIDRLRPRSTAAEAAVDLPRQTVEPGKSTLEISLELPEGYKLNGQAPSSVRVTAQDGREIATFTHPGFPLSVPLDLEEGETGIQVDFVLYYCEAGKESLCYFRQARVALPVTVRRGAGTSRLKALYRLTGS